MAHPTLSQLLLAAIYCRMAAVVVGTTNANTKWEAPEPFPELFSFNATGGPPQLLSPDPLLGYTWSFSDDHNKSVSQQLQIYRVDRPVAFQVHPPNAITGTESLLPHPTTNKFGINLQIQPNIAGSLRLDWGVERAAWLEFISHDMPTTNCSVTASISEFNVPQKTLRLTKYGSSTYRLEPNSELYEGVRYTWIHFTPSQEPWNISAINLVAKIKPVAYTGRFHSGDDLLTQAWYTGAYGVRLNMQEDAFNSVLVERGDRVSIQGDGHPTMAASLAAFGIQSVYQLIKDMLRQTNSGTVHGHHVVDEGIKPYPIYWTMSVNDWYMASGDTQGFLELAPDMMSIIDKRIEDFLTPNLDLVWMGWDDRLGDGWCSDPVGCGREAHLAFAALIVRACHDLGRALSLAGNTQDGSRYQSTAQQLGAKLRQVPEWPLGFGLHAAANVLNAKSLIVKSKEEVDQLFHNAMNDAVTGCSFSNFNQYWNIQGYGNANRMDHALASIKLCWGTQLKLGKGCFWENYSPYWAPWMLDGDQAPIGVSYCHPWASGVTAWMSNVLGGLQPLLPGYAEFVAAPYVSVRYPSVEATVPTPYGALKVEAHLNCDHTKQHSHRCVFTTELEAATPGFIAIRKLVSFGNDKYPSECKIDPNRILWNGKLASVHTVDDIRSSSTISSNGQQQLIEHYSPAVASSLLLLRVSNQANEMHTAKHFIVATYECSNTAGPSEYELPQHVEYHHGIPHFPPFPKPQYPAALSVDSVSSGNGLEKYGVDGFVLFGYHSDGSDQANLPPYVYNVTVHNHGYTGWHTLTRSFVGQSSTNSTYLPFESNRALGMIGRDSYSGMGRGMIIDFDFKGPMPCNIQVSIYCVARSSNNKHFLRVQDAQTRALIAPSQLVSNYTNGMWVTIEYNKSFRVRLMGIQGAHASAVAFVKMANSNNKKPEMVATEA